MASVEKMSRKELDEIFEATQTILEAKQEDMTGKGEHKKSLEGLMKEWYPHIPFWKIYNAMRVLQFFSGFEQQLGKQFFEKEPLWIQLANKGYTLATMYVFVEGRYQKAPILKYLVDILEGKLVFETVRQIQKTIEEWYEKEGVELEEPKHRNRRKNLPPTEKVIEAAATKSEKTRSGFVPEQFSKLEVIAMFHAAENLIDMQDNQTILPPLTLEGYMHKHYPQYTKQQLYQTMRIIRVLSPYEEQIGETFQFSVRRIYLQLLDRDLSLSAIYSFTKSRFQAAPIKDILKNILTGKLQLATIPQIEKHLSEQSNLVVESSPVPLTITEEEADFSSKELEEILRENDLEETEPKQTIPTLLDRTLPWIPQQRPIPTRFPLELRETIDGNRKAVTKGNFQLTAESLTNMRIYLVAQGSNGVVLVSNRFIYRNTALHNDSLLDRSEEQNRTRVNGRLRFMKKELEQLFKNAYPHPTSKGELPRILFFEEVYAQSRSNIVHYLQKQHYYLVNLRPPKPVKTGKRGRKRVDNSIFINQ